MPQDSFPERSVVRLPGSAGAPAGASRLALLVLAALVPIAVLVARAMLRRAA